MKRRARPRKRKYQRGRVPLPVRRMGTEVIDPRQHRRRQRGQDEHWEIERQLEDES